MPDNRPVGIFDSGIGGLTIARSVKNIMPNEQILFVGDTAHLPYGDKSPELIKGYALKITDFLLRKNCKAVIIACNTASAAAYEVLRDQYKGVVPVINVIDPMIERVVSDDTIKKVGIIATRTTIATGVYQEKLSRRKPNLQFAALATPLLATMIEEGFYNNKISKAVLKEYLSHPSLDHIDALVLACTHYPLIKKEIAAFFHEKVKMLDSAEIVALKLKVILEKENLATKKSHDHDIFYVTDYTLSFEETTRIFYEESLKLNKLNYLDL